MRKLDAVTNEQSFMIGRFGQLLHRRLQVAIALREMPAAAGSQEWLIRALDGAIADDWRLLNRTGMSEVAAEQLDAFRRAMRRVGEYQTQAA